MSWIEFLRMNMILFTIIFSYLLKISYAQSLCVVNVTNNNNVGHIYANVLPAVLQSPRCNTFFADRAKGSPIEKIMNQINLPINFITNNEYNYKTYQSRSGSGFEYLNGFIELKRKISEFIKTNCSCPTEKFDITIFNRQLRGLHNYPQLLRRLHEEGYKKIRYFDSTFEDQQCWYFCLYSTTSLVIGVYGSESIYPFLTNTSYISIAYPKLTDNFLQKVRSNYKSAHPYSMKVTVVKASIVEEYYSQTCINFWKSYTSFSSSSAKSSPLLHKCISLYLDTDTISLIVKASKQMEPPMTEK